MFCNVFKIIDDALLINTPNQSCRTFIGSNSKSRGWVCLVSLVLDSQNDAPVLSMVIFKSKLFTKYSVAQ